MGVLFKKACTLNQTADEICMTSSTTLRSPALASLSPHIGNGGVLPNRRTLDPPLISVVCLYILYWRRPDPK